MSEILANEVSLALSKGRKNPCGEWMVDLYQHPHPKIKCELEADHEGVHVSVEHNKEWLGGVQSDLWLKIPDAQPGKEEE